MSSSLFVIFVAVIIDAAVLASVVVVGGGVGVVFRCANVVTSQRKVRRAFRVANTSANLNKLH